MNGLQVGIVNQSQMVIRDTLPFPTDINMHPKGLLQSFWIDTVLFFSMGSNQGQKFFNNSNYTMFRQQF